MVGWTSRIWEYYFVIFTLLLNGFDCIAYEYRDDILSPNVKKTFTSFQEVANNIFKDINFLKVRKYKDIFLFGTSLGGLLSLIVANKSKNINKIILNLTGANLAETVWGWDKINKEFKKNLVNQKITLPILNKVWKKISPINNLAGLSCDKILIYLAKKDEVIPFSQGMQLVNGFKKNKIKYELIVSQNGGNVLSGFLNLLKFKKYIGFLNETLL